MVERFSINFPMGRTYFDANGPLVRHSDYEALEAENAELRDRVHYAEGTADANVQRAEAAEADKARLSEALREIATLNKSRDQLQEMARAALSGSGWRAMEGWKLVPVEPTEAMVDATPVFSRCGRDWRLDAVAAYRAMLSAAPQQGRE